MLVVSAGLAAVFAGGLVLLGVAVWWSWTGDGIAVPRPRWPAVVRLGAVVGWALFVGGILVQVVAYLAQVGVARWPSAISLGH
jgi:hypothetical protein